MARPEVKLLKHPLKHPTCLCFSGLPKPRAPSGYLGVATALTSKSKRAMQVHSLQSGIKPPDELKDLHFGDVYMLVREATTPRAQQREI